ncbi:hypothetical protein IMG5_035540 [Ichthyophthirius multifiliis]|uniref:Uncharacterized protein n=1 Tax=Ichthyophthirius multifiliis TaxID=5932 RepID=G0QLS1_ICHMU|nr:hypothetical protein IMG5_035540 [Ichthyophthirius multifiliis]EGR33834.1 hypothetical protein IMG5_035540 [Ichthyophthirius multifiliis]|eukprot:XP_004039058.1 hypothetical protein IMG5_035540 [Ichthyophthirius multifiliis]
MQIKKQKLYTILNKIINILRFQKQIIPNSVSNIAIGLQKKIIYQFYYINNIKVISIKQLNHKEQTNHTCNAYKDIKKQKIKQLIAKLHLLQNRTKNQFKWSKNMEITGRIFPKFSKEEAVNK